MAKLTDKQELFISYYLTCWNATEAARRAGYQGDSATLAVVGHENLRKPNIEERIKERLATAAMGADEVLLRLGQQARAEQAQFWKCDFGEKVYIDMVALLEAGYGHLIKSVTKDADTGKITKVEFYDAQAALVHLGKHHKLFTDKTEVSGALNVKTTAADLNDDELASIAAGSG